MDWRSPAVRMGAMEMSIGGLCIELTGWTLSVDWVLRVDYVQLGVCRCLGRFGLEISGLIQGVGDTPSILRGAKMGRRAGAAV